MRSKASYPNLTIETLILVAIWQQPAIFQGSFQISNCQNNTTQTLFFRCEADLADKASVYEQEFSPDDYRVTHLFNEYDEVDLTNSELDLALYLLKYALKITLEKMVHHPSQYLAYMDEIAVSMISQQIQQYFTNLQHHITDDNLGFAVAMDFTATEEVGQKAVSALLAMAKLHADFQVN